MREGIHPNYYQAKVVCNCGNEFVTGSTKEEIHVEICSKCHSFYTGQQKAAKARVELICSTVSTVFHSQTNKKDDRLRLKLLISAYFCFRKQFYEV